MKKIVAMFAVYPIDDDDGDVIKMAFNMSYLIPYHCSGRGGGTEDLLRKDITSTEEERRIVATSGQDC